MAEPEKTKRAKEKAPKSSDGSGASRSLAARVERSLKDVDRLLKKSPETSAQDKAMAQLEQAKVSALLQLADAIRENRRAGSPPGA
jgi:hypothetical protein